MRLFVCGFVIAFVAALFLRPASAAEFMSCFEDLPLMEGLIESADTCTNFDTPSGRIAVGEAEGRITADEVRDFYRGILPVFGWAVLDVPEVVLEREGERLVVTVVDAPAGGSRVRYTLAPRR